jgi:Fe-Mn family superoxide dismutase
MKNKIVVLLLISILSTSCKKEKELIEVTIPEPEKIEKTTLGNPSDVQAEDEDGAFQMNGLPYSYNSLEPFIDATTMELHYSKHHLAYCNKLNAALKETDLTSKSIEEILKKLDTSKSDIRNNAGGYYNHNLFFEILNANGGDATDEVLEAINKDFGSFEAFKNEFSESATKLFGSGWVWLIKDNSGKLVITTTANQDNPLMPNAEKKGTPILTLDVWEHAYYVKYQNKRKDYINAFFNVINWKKVNEKFKESTNTKE